MKHEHPVDPTNSAALLRSFEPVIRFTKGEWFYPMDVEPYVRSCSLWVQHPDEEAVCVVPQGKLTLETLGQQPLDSADAVHYLKIPAPEKSRKRGLWTRLFSRHAAGGPDWPKETFRAGRGRLARVGYVSRLADALFSLVLLLRGRVPGEGVEGARVMYGDLMEKKEHYQYHGRVVRQAGWIVLQYWLFYPFNDWRSNFSGANNHEADWEKVFVYLSESKSGEILPEWVAYAAHEEAGDRLRRRWDDPELEKIDEHPVVYVCAGSHASRYFRGEYLTELEFPLPRSFAKARKAARLFWYKTLRQYAEKDASELFTIPFVDYGRGDGLSVGPNQDREWDPPRLMEDPVPSWVSGYRGLWGLYTRDPFEGEDAPAGPMYDRNKAVSREWYDPVGWAGLDKVPTRAEELTDILEQRSEIEERRDGMRAEILQKSRDLRRLGIAAEATRGRSHLRELHEAQRGRIAELSREVAGVREELSTEGVLSEALVDHTNRLRNGERPPANAHIARAARPLPESEARAGRVAQLWASISVAVVLLTLTGILFYQREHLLFALVFAIAVLAFVEAGFRKRLDRFMISANIGLSVVGAFVLLDRYFWHIIVLSVLAVGLYILWENLRELGR
ncbi:MAG TPA: hypothetical protein VEY13_15260 [Rubrobacteraceae bacterium]|nr:hypothetical protein [Rubrobacteraceae bacterium]